MTMKIRKYVKRLLSEKRKRPLTGMTLIELLIVVALSAIILIALLSLYIAGQKYFFNQNSRADTIEDSRMPMSWVSRDIREASSVHDGAVTAYNGSQYVTGETCLVLEVPSLDGTGSIIPGNIDYIIYSYDSMNRRLLRIISPTAGTRSNSTRVMADDLVDDGNGGSPFKLFYFQSDGLTPVTSSYDDATNGAFIVEIELTSQGRALQRGGQPFLETVRTQAKLRNKVLPG